MYALQRIDLRSEFRSQFIAKQYYTGVDPKRGIGAMLAIRRKAAHRIGRATARPYFHLTSNVNVSSRSLSAGTGTRNSASNALFFTCGIVDSTIRQSP